MSNNKYFDLTDTLPNSPYSVPAVVAIDPETGAPSTGDDSLLSINSNLGDKADPAAENDTGSFSVISLVKRGLQNWTTLFSRLPASISGRVPVSPSVPTATSGTILGLTTSATGANYTAFASQACIALDIVNNTGATVEYRRDDAGTAMQIPTGTARMVIGITNANQVGVRRTDASNTQVTLQAEAFVN